MKPFTLILLGIACAASAMAQPSAALEKEKAELLRLHQSNREAHFKTDVDALLENSPEEMISVSRGKINRPSKEDARKMFTGYFRDAKYYEWDDVEEPIVRISNDASMAWMITRTRVRRVQKKADGAEQEEKFVYAGITTYAVRGRPLRRDVASLRVGLGQPAPRFGRPRSATAVGCAWRTSPRWSSRTSSA